MKNTDENTEAMLWCHDNGIRVTPTAIRGDKSNWFIEVSTDHGATWKKSPNKYTEKELWDKLYELYKFYYNKYGRK